MFQFIYNEDDSEFKKREVYYLYYNDKLYYSRPLLIPVKLELDRRERYILLNNILVNNDEEMCRDIFKFIISAKDILNIEGYRVNDCIKSGELYKEIYNKDII